MRLVIDVALEDGRIRGTLSDERGEPIAFSGWLALASAIERLSAGAVELPSELDA